MTMKEENKIILYQDDNEITRVSVRFADEDLWLTQNQLADIYQTTQQNIALHIKNIYADGELNDSTHKDFSVDEILEVYKLLYKQVYKSKWYFKKHTIQPAMIEGYVEMTYPDSPNHPKQRYRLTTKGLRLLDSLKHNK